MRWIWASEIVDRYLALLESEWIAMATLAAAGISIGMTGYFVRLYWFRGDIRNRDFSSVSNRYISHAIGVVALVWGFFQVVDTAAIVDDAFITFRYSRNLVDGHGLVFNPGEQVEGFTNFLWAMLLAGFYWITPFDVPFIALVLCLVTYGCNLFVIYLLGRTLVKAHRPGFYFPLAVVLAACQNSMVHFGTTGLETGMAGLWVNLGLYFLLRQPTARSSALSGGAFILAVFTRPDHAIFFCAGGIALAITTLNGVRKYGRFRDLSPKDLWDRHLRNWVAYGSPALIYGGFLIFRYSYYGSIVPNTYFAKSVEDTYFSQGAVYALSFLTGSHFWMILPLFAVWLFRGNHSAKAFTFRVFAGIGSTLYLGYVLKVGGDFMYGRFFVTLIPLVLLGCEDLIYSLLWHARRVWHRTIWALTAMALVGIMAATCGGVPIVGPRPMRWSMARENEVYKLLEWYPVRVSQASFRVGRLFGRVLHDRGIEPVLSSPGVGMISYYAKLPVIDQLGLTDSFVARVPVHERGRPGHEKKAPRGYLIQRGVTIARVDPHPRLQKLSNLRARGVLPDNTWHFLVYRPEIAKLMKERCPEIQFVDFEAYLDKYIKRMNQLSPKTVREDLAAFRMYYFNHNDDTKRRRKIENFLAHTENAGAFR